MDWIGTLTFQFAIVDFDEAGGGDAAAVEEGRMLESAGLLDADVEVVGGVGDLCMYVNLVVRKHLTKLWHEGGEIDQATYEDPHALLFLLLLFSRFLGWMSEWPMVQNLRFRIVGEFLKARLHERRGRRFWLLLRGRSRLVRLVRLAIVCTRQAAGLGTRDVETKTLVRIRRRIIYAHDALDGVSPFFGRVDPHPVPLPAKLSFPVHLDGVIDSFFSTQIADLHAIQLLAGAVLEADIPPFAIIQPVEEIVVRRPLLPFGMVLSQMGAVAMVYRHFLVSFSGLGGFFSSGLLGVPEEEVESCRGVVGETHTQIHHLKKVGEIHGPGRPHAFFPLGRPRPPTSLLVLRRQRCILVG